MTKMTCSDACCKIFECRLEFVSSKDGEMVRLSAWISKMASAADRGSHGGNLDLLNL